MGKRAPYIKKKAVALRLDFGKCQEPGCGQKVYVVKGKKLTRCADHAAKHDEKEAIRKKTLRKDGYCSECKERRRLAPGLATCLECAGITGDAVGDCYVKNPSKKKSYIKMARAGYDAVTGEKRK